MRTYKQDEKNKQASSHKTVAATRVPVAEPTKVVKTDKRTGKKTFRSSMNYSAAECMSADIRIGAVGVSMPIPKAPQPYQEMLKSFERSQDWLSLGLFGNTADFFGETVGAAKDIIPKPEDYIEIPFRLLSATTVGSGTWKATDFSNVAVLKKAYKLLEGKGVYKDHETDTNNCIGMVSGIKWSSAFDNGGVKVPAGIDGLLAIDTKIDPVTARNLLRGSVYSNSVTVEFEWEMSHSFESEWEFYERVGTMGSDGKMIRRIVTLIHNFHETSIVWLGADPFAKSYGADNQLRNVDVSSIYSYGKAKYGTKDKQKITEEGEGYNRDNPDGARKYTINFGVDENILSLAKGAGNPPPKKVTFNNPENNKEMNKFLIAFLAKFGQSLGLSFTVDANATSINLSDEQVTELQTAMQKLGVQNPTHAADAQLGAQVRGMALAAAQRTNPTIASVDMTSFMVSNTFVENTRLAELNAASTNLALVGTTLGIATEQMASDKLPAALQIIKLDAEAGKAHVQLKRETAISLYKKTVGEGKEDAAVIELFNKANDSELTGLLKLHVKTATQKFSGSCSKCGSTEFKFQSTIDEGATDDPEQPVVAKTTEDYKVSGADLRSAFRKTQGLGLGAAAEGG